MRLIRDLWAASPRRTAVVAFLVVLGAAGQAAASAIGGAVLIHRSWVMFGVLAAALAAAVLTDLAVGLIMARLTADWAADVRRRLCRVAFGQDLPTLETTPVGELLDRIDNDVYQVAAELRNAGVRIAQSACYTVLSIATALFVWWPAGIAMIVIAVALYLGLRKPTAKIAASRMGEEEAWSDLAAVMEESIHGQDDVRTSLARPYVLRLFARRAAVVLERGRRVWVRSAAVTSVASGFVRLTIAVIVLGGVWALATGHLDVARLSAVWLLALGFGATVEHTSRMVPDLQYALGAWARVQLLRDSAQEPLGGRTPEPGDLEVRDLTFRYSGTARKPALRDVRLTFARGRSYALIGRTGSGKSTLAKVLTRAVDLPRGTVFLGGVDLLDLDLELLRRWIAVVPQRTEILAGTLAENIALFDPALLGAAGRAIDELGLAGWVAELPDGLQTRLGDGGHVLSAGQEQLVAFARIVVRDPQVVILDEATARLDPVTEAQVQRATGRLLSGRIGIIVAHRLSSVQQCDEVVVLSDGAVLEAGPLATSSRFAALLADSSFDAPVSLDRAPVISSAVGKSDPPPLPSVPRTRTMWNIFKLATNDWRFGIVSVVMFALMSLVSLDGSVLPWLWADLVDGAGGTLWPAVGITAALLVPMALPYYTGKWFPEWWVRQLLRISLRLVHGQTGARRVSKHTPAEVVAQGGDTERVVVLADNLVDQWICLWVLVSMTVVAGSFVPAAFMAATIVLSGLAATLFGPWLKRSAQRTVTARAAFATALVSSLSAARTVKLAGATAPVLAHLAELDRVRSGRLRQEIAVQVWARSTPALASGLLPIGAWALLLSGRLTAGATLIAVSTLGSARWFAWTTASLISQLPSARVWTRRTIEMVGNGEYAAAVPGVDLSAGTAPSPPTAPRHPLRRLDLDGFAAVHEDGTVAVRDLDLSIERGQLVLVVGPVGSGKSSLLRALAGIVHHTGRLRWNGEPVTEPEMFLRPNQIGYVAQLPRVLSGTVADNIALGHEVDATSAVSTAQLEHDLTAAGAGLGLLIGHKGTRLSGGQLQRLALARALAPRTELLIADDVSSALDVTTELALWRALREHGITVIGSTSKRAALTQADRVIVLQDGTAAAQGTWRELEPTWGHLAG
ncbi:ATP-binding cassette domain-containing protein [Dactylosporangium sp. CS-047395]|uniref:ATP-binding cassette domain-containing protein n=1 Tax=Dactylosporangium sp. CS-047395 TaxID=3239936 RepID=UPI003D8BED88